MDKLRKDILKTLNQIKPFIILGHYKNHLKKIDLYREKLIYRMDTEKKLISHNKIWGINDNR